VKPYADNPTLAPPAENEPHWYAVYTCARHEKRIAEQFGQRSIEQFLPLYETVHRWKDRRVRVQLPIFPSYIFVRIRLTHQLRVLQIPGVVRLVCFNGKPVALPEWEISALQRGLSSGVRAEPYPYLATGRQVRIKAGPLCGLTGRIVRRKQNFRIVISVDSISRSIICEVSPEDVEAVGPTRASSAHAEIAGHRDQSPRPLPGEVVA
jgi:transcription antitermination factor NusG